MLEVSYLCCAKAQELTWLALTPHHGAKAQRNELVGLSQVRMPNTRNPEWIPRVVSSGLLDQSAPVREVL
ncbi:hypothetical protein BGZ63DRAFT_375791 [Mariannaea sp. PMI_226]|nr:hypothetical protein BGZ63DRAFT_375791 [Mariannaea sp. PMI_226]